MSVYVFVVFVFFFVFLFFFYVFFFVFFQAEDGIRDLVRSRGLGDVYKRQATRNMCGYHDKFIIIKRIISRKFLSEN